MTSDKKTEIDQTNPRKKCTSILALITNMGYSGSISCRTLTIKHSEVAGQNHNSIYQLIQCSMQIMEARKCTASLASTRHHQAEVVDISSKNSNSYCTIWFSPFFNWWFFCSSLTVYNSYRPWQQTFFFHKCTMILHWCMQKVLSNVKALNMTTMKVILR